MSVEVISSIGHRLGYSRFFRVARVCLQGERSEPLPPGRFGVGPACLSEEMTSPDLLPPLRGRAGVRGSAPRYADGLQTLRRQHPELGKRRPLGGLGTHSA
jgi:hypothetical protein